MSEISYRQDRLLHSILDATTALQHITEQTCEELEELSSEELRTSNERYFTFYSQLKNLMFFINRTLEQLFDVTNNVRSQQQQSVGDGGRGESNAYNIHKMRILKMSERVRSIIILGAAGQFVNHNSADENCDALDKIIFRFKMRCGEMRDTIHQLAIASDKSAMVRSRISSFANVYRTLQFGIKGL